MAMTNWKEKLEQFLSFDVLVVYCRVYLCLRILCYKKENWLNFSFSQVCPFPVTLLMLVSCTQVMVYCYGYWYGLTVYLVFFLGDYLISK